MRVTSDIWVHVFMRREANRGAYTTIYKKGALEAGTIYIIHSLSDGAFCLYGPAPQSLFENDEDDRKFETILSAALESEIDTYLEKQNRFDPDIWVIETQCRQGPPSIDIVE